MKKILLLVLLLTTLFVFSRGDNMNNGYKYEIKDEVIFKIDVNDTTIVDTIAGIVRTIETKITNRIPIDTLKGDSIYFHLVSLDDYFSSKDSAIMLKNKFIDKQRIYEDFIPYVYELYNEVYIKNGVVYVEPVDSLGFDWTLIWTVLYFIFFAFVAKFFLSSKYIYFDGTTSFVMNIFSRWVVIFMLFVAAFIIFIIKASADNYVFVLFNDIWIFIPMLLVLIFAFREKIKISKIIAKELKSDVSLNSLFLKKYFIFSFGYNKGIFDLINKKILMTDKYRDKFDLDYHKNFILLSKYNSEASMWLYGWVDLNMGLIVEPVYVQCLSYRSDEWFEGFHKFFNALSENNNVKVVDVESNTFLVNRSGEVIEKK